MNVPLEEVLAFSFLYTADMAENYALFKMYKQPKANEKAGLTPLQRKKEALNSMMHPNFYFHNLTRRSANARHFLKIIYFKMFDLESVLSIKCWWKGEKNKRLFLDKPLYWLRCMFFKQIQQHSDNFSYIIADEDAFEAAVVDSSFNSSEIIKVLKAKKFSLKYIINTHGHSDHTAGNTELTSIFGAKLVAINCQN